MRVQHRATARAAAATVPDGVAERRRVPPLTALADVVVVGVAVVLAPHSTVEGLAATPARAAALPADQLLHLAADPDEVVLRVSVAEGADADRAGIEDVPVLVALLLRQDPVALRVGTDVAVAAATLLARGEEGAAAAAGRLVANALKTVIAEEKPDYVIFGKQAVDGDNNGVGQMVAELLDWPMATFAATIQEEDGSLLVSREVDGGMCTLRVKTPAVVTVDLRIVAPESVYSMRTDKEAHKYSDGVRFAALPAIMKAKKKPIDVKALADTAGGVTIGSNYANFEAPAARAAGVKVEDVAALVDKLANEAKAI